MRKLCQMHTKSLVLGGQNRITLGQTNESNEEFDVPLNNDIYRYTELFL